MWAFKKLFMLALRPHPQPRAIKSVSLEDGVSIFRSSPGGILMGTRTENYSYQRVNGRLFEGRWKYLPWSSAGFLSWVLVLASITLLEPGASTFEPLLCTYQYLPSVLISPSNRSLWHMAGISTNQDPTCYDHRIVRLWKLELKVRRHPGEATPRHSISMKMMA